MEYKVTCLVFIYVCALSNAAVLMLDLHTEWEEWKMKYEKTYATEEIENFHRGIWKNNYRYVEEHNNNDNMGYMLETNSMADQSVKMPNIEIQQHVCETENNQMKFAPESWDWRTKGAVGPVQSQGQLGDAQAIVAAECVDSYEFIKTEQLVDASMMEVHDCCVIDRFVTNDMFQCIHNIGGLCSSASYPKSAGKCSNDTCSPIAQVNGGMTVARGDEVAMLSAVYKTPVMALVDSSHVSFQLYKNGIYSDPQCSSTGVDHVLQVVGYGSMQGTDYWICKNSWGVSWGDKGYIYIARNKNNMCGIATQTQYPV